MEYNNQQQYVTDDEISLKDLILLVQKYFYILLRAWWIIGLSALLMGGLFFWRVAGKKTTYSAELSYTSASGSGLAGLAGGLVGRFLGGNKSNPMMKIQAMISTRKIAYMALFQKAYIDGELDYLINHHGRIYEMKDFIPFNNNELKTEEEREIFQKVIKTINKTLLSKSVDEESGIAKISVRSTSEAYAIKLVEEYFNSLLEFYKETEVGEQQKTLEALEYRADSIYNAIQSTAYRAARLKDADKGIFWAVDKVPETQAATELSFLGTAYQEIVKNLETIKFTVASNMPAIQAIDYPISPIEPNPRGRLKSLVIGVFIGGFLASILIIGNTIFREIMADDSEE